MISDDAALATSRQQRMARDQHAVLEDLQLASVCAGSVGVADCAAGDATATTGHLLTDRAKFSHHCVPVT
jgi:hypothetical protein